MCKSPLSDFVAFGVLCTIKTRENAKKKKKKKMMLTLTMKFTEVRQT